MTRSRNARTPLIAVPIAASVEIVLVTLDVLACEGRRRRRHAASREEPGQLVD
jgi:hypothetical protein